MTIKPSSDSSSFDSEDQSSGVGLLLGLLGVVFAILSAIIPTMTLPFFKAVFDSSGVELPMVARLFFDYHRLLWLLPVLVIVLHFYWPKKNRLSLWVGMLSFMLTIPFTIFFFYSPVLRLGKEF
jgi:hypothetical protein